MEREFAQGGKRQAFANREVSRQKVSIQGFRSLCLFSHEDFNGHFLIMQNWKNKTVTWAGSFFLPFFIFRLEIQKTVIPDKIFFNHFHPASAGTEATADTGEKIVN